MSLCKENHVISRSYVGRDYLKKQEKGIPTPSLDDLLDLRSMIVHDNYHDHGSIIEKELKAIDEILKFYM